MRSRIVPVSRVPLMPTCDPSRRYHSLRKPLAHDNETIESRLRSTRVNDLSCKTHTGGDVRDFTRRVETGPRIEQGSLTARARLTREDAANDLRVLDCRASRKLGAGRRIQADVPGG